MGTSGMRGKPQHPGVPMSPSFLSITRAIVFHPSLGSDRVSGTPIQGEGLGQARSRNPRLVGSLVFQTRFPGAFEILGRPWLP